MSFSESLLHFYFQIIFPDLSDANIKPIEKSQVTITGIIDGVYKAKQQLIVSGIYLLVDMFNSIIVSMGIIVVIENLEK